MFPEIKIHTTTSDVKYAFFDQAEVIADKIKESDRWNGRNLSYSINSILKRKDSGTVLDIGSGVGSFSIPIFKSFPGKFDIYSFEPQRPIFYQLCTNLLLNQISHIFAKNEAISSENKVETSSCLNVWRSGNHGSFSLIKDLNDVRGVVSFEDDKQEKITFKTIDDNYSFDDVVLVKVSVCGMEYEVLLGAKNTLVKNNNPPLIVESWNMEFNQETFKNCLSILKDIGYCAYIVIDDFIYAVNTNDVPLIDNNELGDTPVIYF